MHVFANMEIGTETSERIDVSGRPSICSCYENWQLEFKYTQRGALTMTALVTNSGPTTAIETEVHYTTGL